MQIIGIPKSSTKGAPLGPVVIRESRPSVPREEVWRDPLAEAKSDAPLRPADVLRGGAILAVILASAVGFWLVVAHSVGALVEHFSQR